MAVHDRPPAARCRHACPPGADVSSAASGGEPVRGEFQIPDHSSRLSRTWSHGAVRDLAVLVLHLLATVAPARRSRRRRSVVAESVLVKHQLLILNRSRTRSPNLRPSDRMVVGLCAPHAHGPRTLRAPARLLMKSGAKGSRSPATSSTPPAKGRCRSPARCPHWYLPSAVSA
jgi:hypothetical protein